MVRVISIQDPKTPKYKSLAAPSRWLNIAQRNHLNKKKIEKRFILNVCYVLVFSLFHGVPNVCFCTDHFVMVPIYLTCLHFLQHFSLNTSLIYTMMACMDFWPHWLAILTKCKRYSKSSHQYTLKPEHNRGNEYNNHIL